MSRKLLTCFGLLALGAALGRAERPPDAEVVERVLLAHRDGSEVTLREIAEGLDGEAWIVADKVWRRSPEAARALAKLVAGERGTRAAAFFDRRGATEEGIYRLLEGLPSLDTEAALERIAGFEPNDPLQGARLELARAELFAEAGDPASAQAFGRAVTLLLRVGWIDAIAEAAARGASIARRTDQYDLAIDLLQAQFEAESERGNLAGQADALLNLGGIRGHLGDYKAAIEALDRALRLASDSDAKGLRIKALGSKAVIQKRRGNNRAAIGTLETAIREAETHGFKRVSGHLRSDLGLVYQLLGAFEVAERQHRTALAQFKAIDDPLGTARAWGDLGVCYLRQGRYEEAKKCLLRAAAFFRRRDMTRAVVLLNLGDTLGALDEPEAARKALNESVEMARALRTPWHEGQAWSSLGRVEHEAGRPSQALDAFAHCLVLAEQVSSHVLREKAYLGRARTLLGQAEYAKALESSREAMDQVARQVAGLSIVRSAEARARHVEVYAVAARAALGADLPEALFEVLEKSRAAAFLETISDRESLRAAVIPDKFRAAEEAARREAIMATEAFRAAHARGRVPEIRDERKKLNAAQAKLEAIHARIQRDKRTTSDLLYPRSASLAEVQKALTGSEAFVSYAVLDEVIAVVVTKRTVRVARFGTSRELLDLCRDYRPDSEASLEKLRAILVEPLRLEKRTSRVIASPDGSLSRIPLSALLGDRDVSLVPSASVYLLLREEQDEVGSDFLAVGISKYHESRNLESLDRAEEEARAVGNRVLLGALATEPALRETLKEKQRWRGVHFACHGRFDAKFPLRSALALTETEADDGRLTAAEIFASHVPADLVVLAACEGGRAAFVPAEGLIGFTRAFLFAGASRVVSSAWTVDDAATTAFMKEFYRQWRSKGQTTSRALRLARNHVRREWKEPRFWAGWQLWGLPD